MIGASLPCRWHSWNRPVRLVDGATITMADTEQNQAIYPEPSSQKPGLGQSGLPHGGIDLPGQWRAA